MRALWEKGVFSPPWPLPVPPPPTRGVVEKDAVPPPVEVQDADCLQEALRLSAMIRPANSLLLLLLCLPPSHFPLPHICPRLHCIPSRFHTLHVSPFQVSPTHHHLPTDSCFPTPPIVSPPIRITVASSVPLSSSVSLYLLVCFLFSLLRSIYVEFTVHPPLIPHWS